MKEYQDVQKNVADNIKRVRTNKGLSQLEFAKQFGFKSATAISLIESNQRGVPIGLLWRISKFSGYSIKDFLLKGIIPANPKRIGE